MLALNIDVQLILYIHFNNPLSQSDWYYVSSFHEDPIYYVTTTSTIIIA